MTLLVENWNYIDVLDSKKNEYNRFQKEFESVDEYIRHLLEISFLNKFHDNINNALTHDYDLQSLMEKNKQLKQEIANKLEEEKKHQTQYEHFLQDRKMLTQEIKDTHEAFLMAKKYYKKYLNMYYTIESVQDKKQKILVQFFTEIKRKSYMYSVWFYRDIQTGLYELCDMNPRLSTYKEIEKKLKETNDVPGALCCIRQSFLKIKQSK